jgi:hypothetical protein
MLWEVLMQIFQRIESCSFRTGMLRLIHYREAFSSVTLGVQTCERTEKVWAQEERGFGRNTAHGKRG